MISWGRPRLGWGKLAGLPRLVLGGGSTPTPPPTIPVPVLSKVSAAGDPLLANISFSQYAIGFYLRVQYASDAAFTLPLTGEASVRDQYRIITATDVTGDDGDGISEMDFFSVFWELPLGTAYCRMQCGMDNGTSISWSPSWSNSVNDTITTPGTGPLVFNVNDLGGTAWNLFDTTGRETLQNNNPSSNTPPSGGRAGPWTKSLPQGAWIFGVGLDVYGGPGGTASPGYDAAGLADLALSLTTWPGFDAHGVFRYTGSGTNNFIYNNVGQGNPPDPGQGAGMVFAVQWTSGTNWTVWIGSTGVPYGPSAPITWHNGVPGVSGGNSVSMTALYPAYFASGQGQGTFFEIASPPAGFRSLKKP